MNYDDLTKIENEQNWKFTQLIIGLSVGILAFSVQTLEGDITYDYRVILYISWATFFLSFLCGLARLYLFQKILRKKSQKEQDQSNSKIKYQEYIDKYNKRNKWVSYLLLIFFILGILTFALFKAVNIAK